VLAIRLCDHIPEQEVPLVGLKEVGTHSLRQVQPKHEAVLLEERRTDLIEDVLVEGGGCMVEFGLCGVKLNGGFERLLEHPHEELKRVPVHVIHLLEVCDEDEQLCSLQRK
jgi:hypothetical protein